MIYVCFRVKELNVEDSLHPDLREYYLCFADALLTKEEEKNDLFEFLKKSTFYYLNIE